MFSSNKKIEQDNNDKEFNQKSTIDKFTVWLIRITCILLIIFFTGILVGLPILLSLIKTQYLNFSLGLKDLLKTSLDYLY